MRRGRSLRWRLALGLAWTAGCYAYVPERAGSTARVGEELRVRLTDSASRALTRYLGPGVEAVDAELSRVEGDSTLVLGVKMVRMGNGLVTPYAGEGLVPVPRAGVRSIEQRRLSRGRTVATVTGVIAGAVLLASNALRTGHVSGGGGSPPPPPPP
jgi:hypothetical protein